MKERKKGRVCVRQLSLSEIHTALLDLLTEFDRVCRTYHLRYSLAYGTLIGAIRHQGFIPWDDDVDVYMPRPDYEEFLRLVNEEHVLSEHFLLSSDRGKHPEYPFYKVMDDRFPIKSSTHIEVPYLYIDIFPLDGVPSEKRARNRLFRLERFLAFLSLLPRWYTVGRAGVLLRILFFWIYLPAMCIGARGSINRITKKARLFPFEKSDTVGVHGFGMPNEAIGRECFESYIEVPFEGKTFFAPAGYDELLTRCYGDYMTPPPPRKRVTHSMKVYSEV